MLKGNETGFILLEMMICLALISIMVSICIPIIHQLKLEQIVLTNRVEVHHQLYNQVQTVELEELPISTVVEINKLEIELEIYSEHDLIIGQGVWTNEKKHLEEALVYFQKKP